MDQTDWSETHALSLYPEAVTQNDLDPFTTFNCHQAFPLVTSVSFSLTVSSIHYSSLKTHISIPSGQPQSTLHQRRVRRENKLLNVGITLGSDCSFLPHTCIHVLPVSETRSGIEKQHPYALRREHLDSKNREREGEESQKIGEVGSTTGTHTEHYICYYWVSGLVSCTRFHIILYIRTMHGSGRPGVISVASDMESSIHQTSSWHM